MSPDLHLRPPTGADIDPITELMGLPGVLRGTGRLPYTSRAWVEARISSAPETHHGIVGERAGSVVAWGGLNRGVDRRAHVADLAVVVHDRHVGQGIGRTMVRALLDLADNWLGLRRVELKVYTDNAPAIALYTELGFEIEGTLRAESLRAGVLMDSHVMARLRAPAMPVRETTDAD